MADKTEKIQHKIAITNGGASILKAILSAPGWYKGSSVATIVNAGEVAQNLSEVKAPGGDAKEWEDEPYHTTMCDGHRDACRECLKHFLREGSIGVNKHLMKLINQLGVETL